MEKILVIGENVSLTLTRALLLEKTGATVVYCTPSELPLYCVGAGVAVVVLCHTVKGDRRSKVLRQVGQRWPDARILQVFGSISDQSMLSGVDGWVLSLEPEKLIDCAKELLVRATR
jgi:hypothetical protein